MIYAENRYWQDIEHSIFSSRYAACLILNDFSGEEVTPREQKMIAASLTAAAETHIESASVDYLLDSGYTSIISTVEAEDIAGALSAMTMACVSGWAASDKDLDCLELVAAHAVYEEELLQRKLQEPDLTVGDSFEIDEIPTFEVDEAGLLVMTSAREIFYRARASAIEAA